VAVDATAARLETLSASVKNLREASVTEIAEAATRFIALGDIASEITSSSRGWASQYASEGAIFVRITNLQRGNVKSDWTDTQHVAPPQSSEVKRTRIRSGDLLVSITAELGLVAVAEDMPGEAYINQRITKITLDHSRYDPYLAATILSLPPCAGQFRRLNDQSAKAGMNLKSVAKLRLPDLSLFEQATVGSELKAVESSADALLSLGASTKHLREKLLESAFQWK
jgi:type I restriction enzyme S subunit